MLILLKLRNLQNDDFNIWFKNKSKKICRFGVFILASIINFDFKISPILKSLLKHVEWEKKITKLAISRSLSI